MKIKIIKSRVILLGIFLLVASGWYYQIFIKSSVVDPAYLSINQIDLNNETLHLSGAILSSGLGFDKYRLDQNNNTLYIQLEFGLVNKNRPKGTFDIQIKGAFENINKVYLKGDRAEDKKLIWSK